MNSTKTYLVLVVCVSIAIIFLIFRGIKKNEPIPDINLPPVEYTPENQSNFTPEEEANRVYCEANPCTKGGMPITE